MLVEEYAKKLETFLAFWREQLISDAELVTNVRVLTREMNNDENLIIGGHYVISPPQD